MQIIGLCGAARSGKDTAAEGLVRIDWTRVAFADSVREGLLGVNPNITLNPHITGWKRWLFPQHCRTMSLRDAVEKYGWDELKKLPEVRGLLQRYGTEGGRDIHGYQCWIEVAKYLLHGGRLAHKKKIVFADVRFPNEADFIHERGGRVYRIERPGNDNNLTDSTGNHSSEHSLDASHWDEVILNDGTVYDLHRKIMAISILNS
jgi:hypothetical protein